MSDDSDDSDVDRTIALAHRISVQLAGKPAQIQGAVLADALAIWLAGHVILDDRDATDKVRRELLEKHLKAVRQLIPENAKAMGLPW